MPLSIFSCAYWLTVRLLWRNVYLGLLPIFRLGCCWFEWAVCIFWRLGSVGCTICKDFLPFCKLSFYFLYGFLCCAKACQFDEVPLVYFCFDFCCFGRLTWENIFKVDIQYSIIFIFQLYWGITDETVKYLKYTLWL